MRIIGYIEHPEWKITLFKMDDKFSIKFENNLFEQTFKFRASDQLSDESALRELVDPSFLAGVNAQFQAMLQLRNRSLQRLSDSNSEDEFPEII